MSVGRTQASRQEWFGQVNAEPLGQGTHKERGNYRPNPEGHIKGQADQDANTIGDDAAILKGEQLILISGNQGEGVIRRHSQVSGKVQGRGQAGKDDCGEH